MPAHDESLLLRDLGSARGEDAARALYRTYSGELFGFALNRLRDRGLAEEVVQDVFMRVWRHAHDYDATRGSVRTWLYGIARNAIIDSHRRASVRPALATYETNDDHSGTTDAVLENALLRWQVSAALERLTDEHRQVIRLAHFNGLTLREIAERTGLPLGTVKSRTSYALRALRLALEEMGVEHP